MSQKVCFKWNNHPINLLTSFKSFRSSDVLVDVTLSSEGHSLKAHKLVLSACSPYFQSLFTENPCQHPIVFMSDMRFEIMQAIMDFIYNGEVNVAQDDLNAFLKAAEALKVKELTGICGDNSIYRRAQAANSRVHSNAPHPQRASTPMKKRSRVRKRSLSDSNKSDEDLFIKTEPLSPDTHEIHEISGDEFYTSIEMKLNDGLHLNSHVPMNVFSSSHHQSTRCIVREPDSEEEYEMETTNLLEQAMDSNIPSNNQGNSGISVSSDNVKVEKKMRNTPDRESSNVQAPPDSPLDVKPIIQFEDSSDDESSMMMYNEQSQPGPSNYKESSLAQQESSQSHDFMTYEESNVRESIPAEILPFLKQRPELTIFEAKQQQPPPTSKVINLYHCEVCSFETNSSGAFQSHIESHKSFKGHDCQTCGKVFKTAGRLHAHMQTHEPGQPFVCMYCEKKFKHNSSLKTHMKIHLGVDIHCPLCDKTFTNNSAMKKHLAVQHQMDDFQK